MRFQIFGSFGSAISGAGGRRNTTENVADMPATNPAASRAAASGNATAASRIPSPRKRSVATTQAAATNASASQSPKPASSPTKTVPASKAAYLCVKETTGHDIQSAVELEWALQNAGYNPNRAFLERYWKTGTQSLTYQEFHHILQTEPLPRKLDIVSYFRKFDPSGKGVIDSREFVKVMTARGSNKVSEGVMKSIVEKPEYRRPDNKFDYVAFCNDVFKTSADLIELSKLKVASADDNLEVNSSTYKVNRKASVGTSPLKEQQRTWSAKKTMYGAFYFEGEVIISHQYNLEVAADGVHEISIKPTELDCSAGADCRLYVFKVVDDAAAAALSSSSSSRGTESGKFQYMGRTPLVLSKTFVSNKSIQEHCSW
jgi:Ca2+-binding EF-hand superfamily protein